MWYVFYEMSLFRFHSVAIQVESTHENINSATLSSFVQSVTVLPHFLDPIKQ